MTSSKYRYGIIAMEKAAQTVYVRTGREDYSLYRKMAVISARNGDFRNAVDYHLAVLEVAKKANNIYEVSIRNYSIISVCNIYEGDLYF